MTHKSVDIDRLLQKITIPSTRLEIEAVAEQLKMFINELLLYDFEKLVYLLYRIDVNEQALKNLLKDNPQTDAAEIITNLIVDRQQEKLRTRAQFEKDDFISEEDKW